jgi:hypothetical protein
LRAPFAWVRSWSRSAVIASSRIEVDLASSA